MIFVLCLVALCSSAAINSAPDAIATPELEQNDQIDELESDDLSAAETANPQYFGTSNLYMIFNGIFNLFTKKCFIV